MKEIIIKGGAHRYLSELDLFKNGLPDGIINKTKPDVGGTYSAANCDKNYIIVCPFRDLVDSIAADKNNKYNIFKCYAGVYEPEFRRYCKDNEIKKIAVTYDSFSNKILKWIDNPNDWYIVVDEYHLLLSEMDYREDSITKLLETIKQFNHYSLLSATPIDISFEIPAFKELPHYKVIWDETEKVNVMRYKTTKLITGVTNFINEFLENGLKIGGVDVEQLFVFFNTVTGIEQIVNTLKINPELVKISCANRIRNKKILGDYNIEPVTNPNKKINFFTKKGFQGCNMFSNNALVIVVSDGYRDTTLIDISTTLEQIVGRLRENKEYHNVFRNYIVHFYSNNNHILDDNEFSQLMNDKESDAKLKISGWQKMSNEERESYSKDLNLEKSLISIVDGKMKINELKRQSFIYKQTIRKQYKDGFGIRAAYNKSNRFSIYTNQKIWDDFNIKVKKAITISYKDLLNDYLANRSEEYLSDYPEFENITKYLSETEIHTLHYNKEKMLARVDDKIKLERVYRDIYAEIGAGFISTKDLKVIFTKLFNKYGIELKVKASLITESPYYNAAEKIQKIDGKSTRGYVIDTMKLTFKI